ncbi:MAG: class IV adenylate cyclase [Candidatus Methanoperedens sp.]|nr:class IV adenylate cyclase [Candidatus Methanoperedens sp.]
MIEIEVKAHVDEPKQMERAVIALGASPIGIESQVDTYYNTPYRDFGETDEALRIRVQNGVSFLTYKGPKMDRVSKTRKEFQAGINDANTMGNILSSLGFFPVATVTKKRKNFRLGDFFISLDEVRNLGDFIEIEMSVKDSYNYEEKVESVFKLIEKLGISRESTIRSSYLEMVLEKKLTG